MYDVVMQKMREGDWGAVARLLRERHGAVRERVRPSETPRRGFVVTGRETAKSAKMRKEAFF